MNHTVVLTGFVPVPRASNSGWLWQFLGGKTQSGKWGTAGVWSSHCLIPPGDNCCSFYLREGALLPCSAFLSCIILGRRNQAFFMLPLFLCVISPITSCLLIPKYGPFGQCSADPMRDMATNRKTRIFWNIIQTCWTKDHPQFSTFLSGDQSHTPPYWT